ncbi:capsular exopolysaccharide synthesis family protein [Clostridium pascui]|uniref:CpsD/CapB family tyrosine-protein kinase n=1 Tax=Clostridium pascui TaxID=46609 RepID=UPI00195A4F19|nr:CpsD/CapB family tyrosine-protein kinase [Clostridium pascui]MBM7869832.1 capsular exopolysaccharide synthesis family protein [Clostridium pascui]
MKVSELITITKPLSPISESYRTLRTNIKFSSVDKDIKVIVVTSSGPGEGKSTTASNLAVVMAQTGNKTVIIDCDQRKPRLHKVFNLSNERGISDVLAKEIKFEDAIQDTGVKDLAIITSGTKPPNPAELLASGAMKEFLESLREKYDTIIIDTPPIVAVTDAQLLSRYADGCILVVASEQADRDAAMKARELLEKVDANMLGVVLNKVDGSHKGYYGAYYSYYAEEEEKK